MPPMDNLPTPEPATLERCQRAAARMPLVHVTSGRVGRPMLWDIVLGVIPTSEAENEYCGDGARFAEEQAGYPPSVYFYAGRANPRYGETALAFGAEAENGRFHSVTPFDTGSVVNRTPDTALALDLGLPPDAATADQVRKRAEYCKAATVTADWRSVFARWLAGYYPSGADGYWERRPELPDPEGLYARNPDGDWAAWAWEVRFHRGPEATGAVAWATTESHLRDIREHLAYEGLPPTPAELDRLTAFFNRLVTPTGSPYFAEELESWCRQTCR